MTTNKQIREAYERDLKRETKHHLEGAFFCLLLARAQKYSLDELKSDAPEIVAAARVLAEAVAAESLRE